MLLDGILATVEKGLTERMGRTSLRQLERAASAAPAPRGFARALCAARGGIALVAELKKASPSAGVIRAAFDVPALAASLAEGGADALSVLTESTHFAGALANLEAAAAPGLPRLQKDFLLHEFQVLEGRAAGADAVLLITEALQAKRLHELARLALDLGMDVLCEAHAPERLRRAAHLAETAPARILVGVNNRDLQTFQVSLQTSLTALSELPRELLVVSESGIEAATDVRRLRDAGARGILVGEALMRAEDPAAAARALLLEVRGDA